MLLQGFYHPQLLYKQSLLLCYISVNKFRKVEFDAIEASGGAQIETTEVVIKGKKSRKERKDEEIEVDNGDFQL